MGRNSGIMENFNTTFFAAISIMLSFIAFVGLWHWEGFFNEEPGGQTFETGVFIFTVALPLRRYIHLSIIPSAFALVLIGIEKFPLTSKYVKKRTISPYKFSIVTMLSYLIQVIPAVIGLGKKTRTIGDQRIEYFGFNGADPLSITWFSDWAMVPWGYAIFSFVFLISIFTGIYFAIFGWFHTKNPNAAQKFNFINAVVFALLTWISFIGVGKFGGFNQEFEVSTWVEYIQQYGFISLFYDGPIRRYSHLIMPPAMIGLILFVFWRFPHWFKKGVRKGAKVVKKKKSTPRKISAIGLLATITIIINLFPAMFGWNWSSWGAEKLSLDAASGEQMGSTWFSDLIMIKWLGYTAMSGLSVFGLFYAMWRSISGGLFDQSK